MRATDDRYILDDKQARPLAITARDPPDLRPALTTNVTSHELLFRCHASQVCTISWFPALSRPLSRCLSLPCFPTCGFPRFPEECYDFRVGFARELPRLLISDASDHFNGFDLNLHLGTRVFGLAERSTAFQ
jgi:hypothetical protein